MCKVSVVMPVYNGEKYLKEAIDSILNQTYTDFEFIIINDCSEDNTEKIILEYKDERIVYLKNEFNMGISRTLNRGIEISKGEYIARMDADDISLPNRFEKQVAYMDEFKMVGVLGTGIIIFGEGIEEIPYSFASDMQQAKADLFFNSSLAHPTVMIRKKVLLVNNLAYEEEYEGLEDFVLWWRISKFAEVNSLEEKLLYYRKHLSQVTKTRSKEFYRKYNRFIKERLSVFSIDLNDNEYKLLEKYCNGKQELFTYTETITYIKMLKKLLDNNKESCYFSQKKLRYVFELSASKTKM
jgi:glycosyltransferase involved in cell wall biosynthesis